MTHFAEILRYATVGVRRSAGMDAVNGRRLGGNWEPLDFAMTSRAVSRDGTTVAWGIEIRSVEIGLRRVKPRRPDESRTERARHDTNETRQYSLVPAWRRCSVNVNGED